MTLHVRTQGDPAAIVPAVRRAIRDVDPRLALTRVRGLADEFERSILDQRTMAMLIGTLGGIALLLAAVGLYSVMAYVTKQWTTEVGLRMSLGATPASVMRLIVARGIGLVTTGILLGGAGALVGVKYIRSLLFGVEATDPFIWLGACALLAFVGLAACALPARHAMRIDPAIALRNS